LKVQVAMVTLEAPDFQNMVAASRISGRQPAPGRTDAASDHPRTPRRRHRGVLLRCLRRCVGDPLTDSPNAEVADPQPNANADDPQPNANADVADPQPNAIADVADAQADAIADFANRLCFAHPDSNPRSADSRSEQKAIT
jgi:hypothetical protein